MYRWSFREIQNGDFCDWFRVKLEFGRREMYAQSYFSAVLTDLKKFNLKKMGSGRFRPSGGDDHQLHFL